MSKSWVPDWLRTPEVDKQVTPTPTDDDKIKTAVAAALSPIEERLKSLDTLTAFVDESRREREAAAAEAAKRNKPAVVQSSDEDLAARLLTDPRSVISELTETQNAVLLQVRAENVRNKVFNENPEAFPYYTGELKQQIDSLLAKQSLQFQNDPDAVANTYYTLLGKQHEAAREGKLKSRFAAQQTSTVSLGTATTGDDLTFEVTPEIAKAAKLNGMAIEDYVALVKRAAKAGEIEYV